MQKRLKFLPVPRRVLTAAPGLPLPCGRQRKAGEVTNTEEAETVVS